MISRTATWPGRVAAATEEPHAPAIVTENIGNDGNAVDAVMAVSFTLAATISYLGGLGRGFFALVKDPDDSIFFVVNGSSFSSADLAGKDCRLGGVEAITVPGVVAGLDLLWRRLGSLEWSDLVSPAVALAREEFPASRTLTESIKAYEHKLGTDPGSGNTYLSNKVSEGSLAKFPG